MTKKPVSYKNSCVWGVGMSVSKIFCISIKYIQKNKIIRNYENSNVKAKQKTKQELKKKRKENKPKQYSKVLRYCFGFHIFFFKFNFKSACKYFKHL